MNKLYKNRIGLSLACSVLTIIVIIIVTNIFERQKVFGEPKETKLVSIDSLEKALSRTFKEKYVVDIDEYDTISSEALKIVYDRNMMIEAKCKDYSLIIAGEDIENYDMDWDLDVEIKKTKQGYEMARESDEPLPGRVVFKINNITYLGKYIYIYNKTKGRYIQLTDNYAKEIEMDNYEKYLITDKLLYEKKVDKDIYIYIGAAVLVLVIIYIIVKKRYWFW